MAPAGVIPRSGILVAIALLATLIASQPVCARGLTTGLIDDDLFTSSARNLWLNRAKDASTGLIRVNVPWREVVASSPPQHPTNPGDPAYAGMANTDATVEAARARGFDVLLTVFSAPDWAQGPNQPSNVYDGTWKPNPTALGQFGQMLAKRYSGQFAGLPRVRYFEAWNEPNLSNYLTPQWVGKTLYSPGHYREMLNSFYEGVKRVQSGAKVLAGETAPFGDDRGHPFIPGQPRMRPLVFLRKLFCLKKGNKPTKCPTKPHLDILSHHPVNIIAPPTRSAKDPDDVEVADFGKLRKLLRVAERAGNVTPRRGHSLWATEIWWFSKPPNPIGVPVQKEARWLEQGLYLLWKQGAQTVINYQIADKPPDPAFPPRQQVTTGIFFQDGTKKPAYTAWRFPLVTHRKSKKMVGVWGKAPDSGNLKVQKRSHGGWRTVKSFNVGRGQVFTSSLRLRGKANLRGKLGAENSLAWYQH